MHAKEILSVMITFSPPVQLVRVRDVSFHAKIMKAFPRITLNHSTKRYAYAYFFPYVLGGIDKYIMDFDCTTYICWTRLEF